MFIRTVQKKDYSKIKQLIITAFSDSSLGYHDEAELVNAIRQDSSYNPELEVIATDKTQVVGHGLLSQIYIGKNKHGLALAPLSVLPAFQNQGIGAQIITELEKRAVHAGYDFISIMGWPKYYAKLGYVSADKYGITAPFAVPADAYLVKAVRTHGLEQVHGQVRYLAAFGN